MCFLRSLKYLIKTLKNLENSKNPLILPQSGEKFVTFLHTAVKSFSVVQSEMGPQSIARVKSFVAVGLDARKWFVSRMHSNVYF